MGSWKSKKDGTHFNTDKTVRSSEPSTEVNVEIDNNSDDFSEGVRKEYEEVYNSKLTKNQVEIRDKLLESDPILTEADINYMKNTINNSFSGSSDEDTEFKKFIRDVVWNHESPDGKNGYRITQDQTEKGLKWLKKFYNNSMGYREQAIFDNFEEFRLIGWHDNAHYGQNSFYVPYYAVYGDDNKMSYHMENGKISIDG